MILVNPSTANTLPKSDGTHVHRFLMFFNSSYHWTQCTIFGQTDGLFVLHNLVGGRCTVCNYVSPGYSYLFDPNTQLNPSTDGIEYVNRPVESIVNKAKT